MKNILIYIISILLVLTSCNNYKEASHNFSSYIIFIDPGHGGKDNGTHYNDIFEDELNLKLSTILYESLLKDNVMAYISSTSDYDLSSQYAKNHKIEDLNNRIKYIESFNTTLFVSLHLNYYPNNNVNGLQVFYQKHNEKSKLLADVIQHHLNKENKKNKQCKIGDYYLLNNTDTLGVLIEYGFLSSEYDRNKLLKDSYLNYLSNIIKKAIYEYLSSY